MLLRRSSSVETGFGPIACLFFITVVVSMASNKAWPVLDNTFGYFFFSGIFSAALWGVSIVQLHSCYEEGLKRWLWVYLAMIWTLDTAKQALLAHSLYVGRQKESTALLITSNLTTFDLMSQIAFGALVHIMVQSAYITRIWDMSDGNYLLTVPLVLAVLGSLASFLAQSGQTYILPNATELRTAISAARSMNAPFFVADTLIALAMIHLLRRRSTGFEAADSIIERFTKYTINTGLIAGLCGIAGVVNASMILDSRLCLLVDIVLPNLYLNCLLALLNSRPTVRETLPSDLDMTSGGVVSGPEVKYRKAQNPKQMEVEVEVETVHEHKAPQKGFWQSSL